MTMREQDRDGHWGPRRSKQLLLLAAVVSLLIILATGALLELDALRAERWIQGTGIGVLAIMAVLLWVRIVRDRWLSLQVQSLGPVPASEETGVWGVGGPGMRSPGATGIYGPFSNETRENRPGKGDRPL